MHLKVTRLIALILMSIGIVMPTMAQTIEVSFIPEVISDIPTELQNAVSSYISGNIGFLNTSETRFIVSSYRINDENIWAELYIVPTRVVESGWEDALIEDDTSASLLAEQITPGQWRVLFRDALTQGLGAQSLPPTEFIDLEAPVGLQALALKFPWIGGQRWFKTNGWHSGNALDMQPVNHSSYSNASVDLAVIAGEAGKVSKVCDDGNQVLIKVEHAGFVTQHLHLQSNSIPSEIIGQNVPQGMYLGHLYTGTVGGGGGYRFKTSCGYGTAIHLHWILSSRSVNICGVSGETVAAAAFATIYTSCNRSALRPVNPGQPAITAPTANQDFLPGNVKIKWNRGTLNWTGKYNTSVQVSKTSDFSQLVYNKTVSGLEVTVSLPDAGSYWVRLRQNDQVKRNSGWTGSKKFTVTALPPPACPLDLNGDRLITIFDVQAVANGYINFGDPSKFNPAWDFNNDNSNTILDLQQIAGAVGTACQS